MSPEEVNEELEKAARSEKRKVPPSKDELTKVLEEDGAKPIKISRKKNLEEVRKIIKNLEEPKE